MRWPWQRALRSSAPARPRLLPSATEGVSFEAVYTITWRPRWRTHPNAEEAVRSGVHAAAARAAAHLDVSDLPAAQDAVNAALVPSPGSHRTTACWTPAPSCGCRPRPRS
ncbi:hypothetical protein [Streptomyces sp. CA-132043]|uniref:hypothetical protein n=1 Tax=Streptomyces sp. CA-132043 TaxID=3240048 RepID=UPI003D92049D